MALRQAQSLLPRLNALRCIATQASVQLRTVRGAMGVPAVHAQRRLSVISDSQQQSNAMLELMMLRELIRSKDELISELTKSKEELVRTKDEHLRVLQEVIKTQSTQVMLLKGRLHVRGLLEEALDILKLTLAGDIQRAQGRFGKLSRHDLFQLFAEWAPDDPLVLCFTQASTKTKPGQLVEQLYNKLSSDIHMAAQHAALESSAIIIPMGVGLNADEVKLLVCLAKTMCLKYEVWGQDASAVEERPGTGQGPSLPEE